jgi:16S rRNA (cytosine1402-N4)-methyltransferase
MTSKKYHVPVLLDESVTGLITDINGIYVDVTFGGGGHSREVLSRLGSKGKLIGFDQDKDAQANLPEDARFSFVPNNFRFLENALRFSGMDLVDGILADLGVSSHQFDQAERGFSIRSDARLDMRMNRSSDFDAEQLINAYDEADLAKMFKEYGELREARRLAGKIVFARSDKRIRTTGELMDLVGGLCLPQKRNSFLARVFQAIRIEVNGEMTALKELLQASARLIKPGGRLVVISYHSLEDRLVKRFMKSGDFDGTLEKDFFGNPIKPFTEVPGMPIVPSEKEIETNNRARSAKLRVATRNE